MFLGNFCATQLPLTVLEWDSNFQQMFSVTRGQLKGNVSACFGEALSVALTALQHLRGLINRNSVEIQAQGT